MLITGNIRHNNTLVGRGVADVLYETLILEYKAIFSNCSPSEDPESVSLSSFQLTDQVLDQALQCFTQQSQILTVDKVIKEFTEENEYDRNHENSHNPEKGHGVVLVGALLCCFQMSQCEAFSKRALTLTLHTLIGKIWQRFVFVKARCGNEDILACPFLISVLKTVTFSNIMSMLNQFDDVLTLAFMAFSSLAF